MRFAPLALLVLALSSCGGALDLPGGHTRGGCGGTPPVNVAGLYSVKVESVTRDLISGSVSHGQREATEIVVSQSGAAVSYTGILGVAGSDVVTIDDRYKDHLGSDPYTVQWSGTIRPDGSTDDLKVHIRMWHPEQGGDTILQDYEVSFVVSDAVKVW